MKKKPRAYTYEQATNLTISEVKKLYGQFVSRSLSSTYSKFGFGNDLAESASGCYITTVDGRKILDATGGIGVLNHGHNHPEVLRIRKLFQEQERMEVHKAFHSQFLAALASTVASMLPDGLDSSYFPNSGAEAIESAMKMAYKYHNGERKVILHASFSFHGKLFGSGSITGSSEVGYEFPKIPGIDSFEYNDLASFKECLRRNKKPDGSSDVYAVVIEPMNVSSLIAADSEFLNELRGLTEREDIILIFDEVYSGWCKTGDLFYFMRTPKLVPDILVYAKSFGGGKASISGLTANRDVFRAAYDNLRDSTLQSTTYFGFGEETATALEALRIIRDDNYVEKSRKLETNMSMRLHRLREKFPEKIESYRGAGALWGVKVKRPDLANFAAKLSFLAKGTIFGDPDFLDKLVAGALVDYMYRNHSVMAFLGSNRDTLLKISLPIVAGEEELNSLFIALEDAFQHNLDSLLLKFIGKNLVD